MCCQCCLWVSVSEEHELEEHDPFQVYHAYSNAADHGAIGHHRDGLGSQCCSHATATGIIWEVNHDMDSTSNTYTQRVVHTTLTIPDMCEHAPPQSILHETYFTIVGSNAWVQCPMTIDEADGAGSGPSPATLSRARYKLDVLAIYLRRWQWAQSGFDSCFINLCLTLSHDVSQMHRASS